MTDVGPHFKLMAHIAYLCEGLEDHEVEEAVRDYKEKRSKQQQVQQNED